MEVIRLQERRVIIASRPGKVLLKSFRKPPKIRLSVIKARLQRRYFP